MSSYIGLNGEIAINRRYLELREPWQVLGTLLHELVHAWQEVHGKPGKGNYHNRQFRDKARSLGLIVNQRGHTHYDAESPFFRCLATYEIDVPTIPPNEYIVRGASKLRKWSCKCEPPINVRVAVSHFNAQCLWCGTVFQESD